MKPITGEWIKLAEEDYRVAMRETKAKNPSFSAICFHSQQCIEKYMKAVLQENNIPFGKIHDLEILLKDCKKFIPELENYRDELIRLTSFSVEVRYPGFEIDEEEVKEALSALKKLRRILKNYFKK